MEAHLTSRCRRTARAGLAAIAALLGACGAGDEGAAGVDASLREQLRGDSGAFAGRSIDELAADDSAMELADRLFAASCAGCHGPDGAGQQGIMDLLDGVFNYGSTAEAVRTTIAAGRHSVMPGVGSQYGEMNLGQLVAYVESLSSSGPVSRLGAQGADLFEASCVACHGSHGRGNPEVGGPNLADGYWLHGDTMMAIRLIITRGAESQCPAQAQSLTPVEIDLLTAHVLNLHES